MSAATADPRHLVESLDSAAILHRLEELAAEEAALRVLLRAARARERQQGQRKPEARKGGDGD
jgi:hypothetical protein